MAGASLSATSRRGSGPPHALGAFFSTPAPPPPTEGTAPALGLRCPSPLPGTPTTCLPSPPQATIWFLPRLQQPPPPSFLSSPSPPFYLIFSVPPGSRTLCRAIPASASLFYHIFHAPRASQVCRHPRYPSACPAPDIYSIFLAMPALGSLWMPFPANLRPRAPRPPSSSASPRLPESLPGGGVQRAGPRGGGRAQPGGGLTEETSKTK